MIICSFPFFKIANFFAHSHLDRLKNLFYKNLSFYIIPKIKPKKLMWQLDYLQNYGFCEVELPLAFH